MKKQEIIQFIVNWTSDYLFGSSLNGFVGGLSGGIDSALVSTLCAMTGKPVHLLIMPIHQHPDHTARAIKHAEWLISKYPNVTYKIIDLTTAYEAFKQTMESNGEGGSELSEVNTRSRHRMEALYWVGNKRGLLVAGTGNKVEDYGIGFFTKFGDGGVDFSPIGDLNKTQVYELARHLGVIEEILSAAPTDGLWENTRTDEDQIGASYPELEWAMGHYDLYGRNTDGLDERQKEVLAIYATRHEGSAHKMEMPPVCTIPTDLFIEE